MDEIVNILTLVPSVIYIIYIVTIAIIAKYYNNTTTIYSVIGSEVIYFKTPSHYNYLVIVIATVAFLEVLIIAYSCDDNFTVSLVLSTLFQLLGWIIIGYNIIRESWHLYLWPSKPIKIFISSYIAIYLLVTAIKREGNSNKMMTETLEQASLFIVTLALLLIVLVKNYYYQDNTDDDVKIRRYFSEDIESNNNTSIITKIMTSCSRRSNTDNLDGDGDDTISSRSSFTKSIEKFYGRVFPSSFWTSDTNNANNDFVEPLLVSSSSGSNNNNDPLAVQNIISIQKEIQSNSKEMSQTLMKHLSDSKNKSVLDVAPKNNKSNNHGNNRNVDNNDKYLTVSVLRWNFRKRQLSLESDHDDDNIDNTNDILTVGPIESKPSSPQRVGNDNNTQTTDDDNNNNMTKSSQPMKPPIYAHNDEVEFEITINVRSKGADSPEQQWYLNQKDESKKESWAIWKTSNEIFTFHLEIVNKFGDLAPRKPRLRTTLGGSSNRNDIISDTRTISTYLTAILRIDQPTAILAFFDFLEMPSHQRAIMSPNLYINLSHSNGVSLIDDGNTSSMPPPLNVSNQNEQLFSKVESTVLNSRQDKHRKLFVAMRVQLKPKEVTIRCRLFHGVVSGHDICKWLLRYGSSEESLSNSVKDRLEANRIGQELLSCGLLLCVAYGFPEDYEDEELQTFNEEVGMNKFSDLPSFIYTFPQKGSTNSLVGKFSLFGEAFTISIPQWSRSEENDDKGGSGRETQTYNIRQSEIMNISGGSLGHIEYLVVVSHLYDEWMCYKRFREFEQLKNSLSREGIKTEIPLPQKGFGMLGVTQIDARKKDLELFLQSISMQVIASVNDRAMVILAKFLDPEFDDLNLVQPKSNVILNTP